MGFKLTCRHSLAHKTTSSIFSVHGVWLLRDSCYMIGSIGRGWAKHWQKKEIFVVLSKASLLLGLERKAGLLLLDREAPINEIIHSLVDKATNGILSVRDGNCCETVSILRGCAKHWQRKIPWKSRQNYRSILSVRGCEGCETVAIGRWSANHLNRTFVRRQGNQ